MKVIVAVDFESVSRNSWWRASVVVVSYPQAKILGTYDAVCQRYLEEFDETHIKFWALHPEAYRYNSIAAAGRQLEEEAGLCRFVRDMLDRYPGADIVSDNPQYDIFILEQMMLNHGWPSTGLRRTGIYRPYVCVSTSRSILNSLAISVVPRSELAEVFYGPRHTPYADAMATVSDYFAIMDAIYVIKSSAGTCVRSSYNSSKQSCLRQQNE